MATAAAAAAVSAAAGRSAASAAASSLGRALAAHIYVSEGRDASLVARLSAAGAASGAVVANEFVDAAYHRSGITLAASDDARLEAGVLAVCRAALTTLDLRSHVASHPRVGVIDHVACNPLGAATCEEAARLALRIGQGLSECSAGDASGDAVVDEAQPAWALPVYLYGAARADRRPLAELRRSLGYFGGASRGEWAGLSPQMATAQRALPPDFGPPAAAERYGAAVVGAVPWVHNFNLLVTPGDDGLSGEELMARCRRIARAVSTRGGGPAAVETMALPHDRGVEVACNLLDVSVTSPEEVRERVADLCDGEGVALDSAYFTNKRPEDILELVVRREAEDGVVRELGTSAGENNES